jgi:hypothetical protein
MRRMLDPEPGPRTTMAEAARELRRLAVAEPEATAVDQLPPPVLDIPPQDTVPTAARPSSEPLRRRPVALAALAALVVLVLVAAGGWWLTRESGQPTADQGAGPDAGPTGKPSPRRSDRPSSSPGSASVRPSPTPTGSSPSSPATGATTATVSPTPPTAGGVDAGSPAALVTDYYSLLPEDTDSAWNLLTPQLQEQIGEGTYQGFWATIDEVRVESAESVDDDVVQVTLVYTTGGRSEQETRQLAVEQTDGGFLISDDLGAV